MATIVSYGLSQLLVAFLAGNAFAGERADRSAEFMSYLPVSRNRRLAGKLILTAGMAALLWGISELVLRGLVRLPLQTHADVFHLKLTAITGLVMFGVGWFVSSIQSSPTFAICAGIAAPMLIGTGLAIIAMNFEIKADDFMPFWFAIISTVLGTLGFAVGTWCFLKRVEP